MSAAIQSDLTPRAIEAPRRRRGILLALLLCLPALVPLLVIVLAVLSPELDVWSHLARYVLPDVLRNTAVLVIGVALFAGMLGTSLAWLVAMCDFPGRRHFEWILLLPLAVPTYVLAFVAVAALVVVQALINPPSG